MNAANMPATTKPSAPTGNISDKYLQVKNLVKWFGDDKAVFDVIINTDNLTANQVIDVTTETVRKLL